MTQTKITLTKRMILESIQDTQLSEATTTGSALGGPYNTENAETGGFFIGPLSTISKSVLRKRLYFPGGKDKKNSTGKPGKIVEPPQGYVNEQLYTVEGNPVTFQMITEWFGDAPPQKPSWNGGKIVKIEPKCLTFPYCSQGDVDKPLKLIGETEENTCKDAWEDVSALAKEAKMEPEAMAKIIREHYIKMMTND